MSVRGSWLVGLLALLWASTAVSTPTPPKVWQIDAARSTLTFTGRYRGVQYAGRFRRFAAHVTYDSSDVPVSRLDVKVDIASLDMRNRARDTAILGAACLDAAQFPRAYFVTTYFLKRADGQMVTKGPLKLHGVIQLVAGVMVFTRHGDTATLDLTTHLQPLDFGIGHAKSASPSMAGDEVIVHLYLVLKAPRPPH